MHRYIFIHRTDTIFMDDFSNNDRDVFLIKTDMIDRGALMSRYSRTANLDIREVYGKEFKNNPDRASNFYKRIFLDYGDESVAELTTAQMGIQNVSNIVTKVIEEPRIGLSYLEKSSRYVKYNKKVNGNYLFLRGENAGVGAMESKYNSYCNDLFDFYSAAYPEMMKYMEDANPIENFTFEIGGKNYKYTNLESVDENTLSKSYKSSLRSAVLDEIRALLPASTLTNIGISGNGRAFISLIERLKAYGTPEAEKYGELIYRELEPELPELIEDAVSAHGIAQIKYNNARDSIGNSFSNDTAKVPDIKVINFMDEKRAIDLATGMLLYGSSAGSSNVDIPPEKQYSILKELESLRGNRRHKLGRAFEGITYSFEVNMNYGAFREFQRHRFFSIIRKPLSTQYGYDIPENLGKIPELRSRYVELMDEARILYNDIMGRSGRKIAQYVVPYAYKYPVVFSSNLNELTYFIELRSNQQVHPDLREVALDIYSEIKKIHPHLATLIKFVDTGDYRLGRLPSEVKKESRRKTLSGEND
ncbi:Thy1 protein [Ferroplasma acidiphilum]|uniref:Thy1 protein n=4 Tax=Ferroplasma acidiphilum TaxID=74969 RepID=A0A1V0N5L6_9ARCH|nr:Thy1 protein [Ferroplasma acidiphilum]